MVIKIIIHHSNHNIAQQFDKFLEPVWPFMILFPYPLFDLLSSTFLEREKKGFQKY